MNSKFVIVSALLLAYISIAVVADEDEPCEVGTTKQEDCNTCRCINEGRWACTRKFCIRPPPTKIKREIPCVDGETKMVECNSCFCSNGNWACTLKGCPPSRPKRDQFACTPGQTFKKECNTCKCTADGRNAICTLALCPQPIQQTENTQ